MNNLMETGAILIKNNNMIYSCNTSYALWIDFIKKESKEKLYFVKGCKLLPGESENKKIGNINNLCYEKVTDNEGLFLFFLDNIFLAGNIPNKKEYLLIHVFYENNKYKIYKITTKLENFKYNVIEVKKLPELNIIYDNTYKSLFEIKSKALEKITKLREDNVELTPVDDIIKNRIINIMEDYYD